MGWATKLVSSLGLLVTQLLLTQLLLVLFVSACFFCTKNSDEKVLFVLKIVTISSQAIKKIVGADS
jgi:hypothetical protein